MSKFTYSVAHHTYKLEVISSFDLLAKQIISPECQRLLDEEHVVELFDFQVSHYEKYNEFFFTNPITLCILNGKEYVIDGQHRLECVRRLCEKGYQEFSVYLTTIYVNDDKEMEDKYIALNKNMPVQLFADINKWKFFYKNIEKYITENYKKYLSNNNNPRSPNFNVKQLMDYFDKNDTATKLKFNSDLFIKEMEKLNTFYKNNIKSIFVKHFRNNISSKIEKSKSKQKNFLLLSLYTYFEWVDRIVYTYENKVTYDDILHYPKKYRVRITKKLRKEVWKKRFEEKIKGCCFCCEKDIEYDDFECGHIQSVHFRGETIKDNLEPICSVCNKDMGTQNLLTYKNEIQKSL